MSVDSTVARAHHHAAGTTVDAELLDTLEKAVAEEKALPMGPNAPVASRAGRAGDVTGEEQRHLADAVRPGFAPPNWGAHAAG
ncbi:hypothetical protein AB0P36_15180 [Streptomyces flavidovirens]|uniref:hypothetical protein n=1 Tax=Streptomyces flavidovirens TaxID=67298 RepID=UPI003426E6F7